MSTSRLFSAFFLFTLFVISSPRCQAQYTSRDEYKLFAAVNQERRLHGLPSLQWNQALAAAARRHAQEMSRHSAISHQFSGEPSLPSRATRAGVRFNALAENVAASSSVSEIHSLFLQSPDHRANILDADMDSIGIGVVQRHGQFFAVEDFSKSK